MRAKLAAATEKEELVEMSTCDAAIAENVCSSVYLK